MISCSSSAFGCRHEPCAHTCQRHEVGTAGTAPHHSAGEHSYTIMPQAYWRVISVWLSLATFRLLYVFVIIAHTNRRLLHVNVTAQPTAQWTVQQFREAIPADHTDRIFIHDRDAIFSKQVDLGVGHMGLRGLKTPVRTPVANAMGERVIGTMRRECLDLVIPLGEGHLYSILKEWSDRLKELVLHGMHPSLFGREFSSLDKRSHHGVISRDLLHAGGGP